MPYFVYIIYSKSQDVFYVGETENVSKRIDMHITHEFKRSFTKIAEDWELFYLIHCESRGQARNIESHIKRMKSRKYYHNLIQYPAITKKLLSRY